MMYKVDELTLITGIPIKIPGTLVEIEQPSLEKIALLGEREFFQAMNIFFIDSAPLEQFVKEIEELEEIEKEYFIQTSTAYENLMFVIKASFAGGNGVDQIGIMKLVNNAFNLLIPDSKVEYRVIEDKLTLKFNGKETELTKELFLIIKDIASQIFMLEKFFQTEDDSEMSEAAKEIARKIAESEKKIRELNGEDEEESYFSRVFSILGVYKDFHYLSSLTIYQLQNQFERHGLYTSYNQSIDASFAGATEVEIVDWYKKI